ncbi:outer membrane biogenesis protein BamB [Gemmata sp. SH-PL17]|uniref:PQQ-binding-like beta-propeller repeat protein n=1 Tax=Gemmata sp. SH-PL17 TaxID=1630693 RepID=UPI00078D6112|nr:PQQ-binding-like beta-propeller repeat protein [Gemmata sp. SH-PL17]AMV30375.1 outer membrane biogenesis protein BamB [Gemmata sp. SH-PL17]
MTESTLLSPDPAPAPSRWRRALVVATIFGAGAYGFGWLAGRDDSGTIPSQAMMMSVMLGPILALLGFALWWVARGDGRFRRRVLGVVAVGASVGVSVLVAHSTMRLFAAIWGVPLTAAITGLALAAVPVVRSWPTAGLIALTALSPWLALRLDGVSGKFDMDTSYRWVPSVAERAAEQLASRATVVPTGPIAELIPESPLDWPGFRGAHRDGVVAAVAAHGWNGSAPRERWRKEPVGPAWSSFSAAGAFIYTQEQRGDSESVVCYQADTGDEVWARGEPGKHSDGPSGIGPRATPTCANGRVFAATASGTIMCLRATDGEPVWVVSLAERFGVTKPTFGYAASPLVTGNRVFINPSSKTGPRLVALDAATGATQWEVETRGTEGYSSPHPATIAGVSQVLIFNGAGLFGHDPETGRELWKYDWVTAQNEPTTVQPLALADGRIVIGGGNVGIGTRCVKVENSGSNWSASEVWKTSRFTPKFNDVVRVGKYLYGLDSGALVCLKLADGSRAWKEGQYGAGQVLLVGDNLLVVSETGQLACVAAKPDEFEELWKIDAVKGKTWNHPIIARGRLYLRNATVMVAFDLPGWSANP